MLFNAKDEKIIHDYSQQRCILNQTSSGEPAIGALLVWAPLVGYLLLGYLFGHTAGLDTILVQIYMDALPGVPGVSKNQNIFFTNKTVEFLR